MEWRDKVVGNKGGYRVKCINEIVAEIGGIFGILLINNRLKPFAFLGMSYFLWVHDLIENAWYDMVLNGFM